MGLRTVGVIGVGGGVGSPVVKRAGCVVGFTNSVVAILKLIRTREWCYTVWDRTSWGAGLGRVGEGSEVWVSTLPCQVYIPSPC